MSAGSRSGVNWMRWKRGLHGRRERADGQGLGQAGHAFEQHVAVGEQADQQPVHQFSWPTMTRPISSRNFRIQDDTSLV